MKPFAPPLLCILLAGCGLFSPQPPYDYSVRPRPDGEYRLTLESREPSVGIEQLKSFFQGRSKEVCGRDFVRLRGMREDSVMGPKAEGGVYHSLRADIECLTEAQVLKNG